MLDDELLEEDELELLDELDEVELDEELLDEMTPLELDDELELEELDEVDELEELEELLEFVELLELEELEELELDEELELPPLLSRGLESESLHPNSIALTHNTKASL